MIETLKCRMCGYMTFSLYTHPAVQAVPEKRVFFGLFKVADAIHAQPERLTATCLRCSCKHTEAQIGARRVRGPFDL